MIIIRIARLLGFTLVINDIDICHRQGKKNGTFPRSIIVKFVSRMNKLEFQKSWKIRRTLKLSDIDDRWKTGPESTLSQVLEFQEECMC